MVLCTKNVPFCETRHRNEQNELICDVQGSCPHITLEERVAILEAKVAVLESK